MINKKEIKTYLIARPALNLDGINAFFNDENLSWEHEPSKDGDLLSEFAGRICYVSFGKKQGKKTNKAYLQNIINLGHGSILEHANYTFLITGAGRGFTHELVRHRAGFAYSQESTHYIDYSIDMSSHQRNDLSPEIANIMFEFMENSRKTYQEIYKKLIGAGYEKKVACSIARDILPIGIESRIVFSANIRALRHFVETRATPFNVDEIREVAVQVYDIMKVEAPNCFMDITDYLTENDKRVLRTEHKKV